ncbi:hypothetical protein [Streptomyces sp. RTd22]|uniref:hypothetical protein n=1 Tax=Streptomyces sp. RTd22 TaxID=1841249 RepID=UPI0013315532|nr:hypothetical protein [Streptomyces sp. RTd22]
MRDLSRVIREAGGQRRLSSPRIVGIGDGLGVNDAATPVADLLTSIFVKKTAITPS